MSEVLFYGTLVTLGWVTFLLLSYPGGYLWQQYLQDALKVAANLPLALNVLEQIAPNDIFIRLADGNALPQGLIRQRLDDGFLPGTQPARHIPQCESSPLEDQHHCSQHFKSFYLFHCDFQ